MRSSQTEDQIALVADRERLQLYYRAMSTQPIVLTSADRSIGEDSAIGSVTLPGSERPGWYRIALAHRAMHYECGTFQFSFNRRANLFRRLVPMPNSLTQLRAQGLFDLDIYFALFGRRNLAIECFTVLEDLRLDEHLGRSYPGLASDLRTIRATELATREDVPRGPRLETLEALVRLSLNSDVRARALPEVAPELNRVVTQLRHPEATVEDTAEAAFRIYMTLEPMTEEIFVQTRLGATLAAPVHFRDHLISEFLRRPVAGVVDKTASFEDILQQRVVTETAIDVDPEATESANVIDLGDDNVPVESQWEGGRRVDHNKQGRAEVELTNSDTASWLYPEWNYHSGSYLRNWCRVREIRPPTSSWHQRNASETRSSQRLLQAQIRAQLERIPAETFRRMRGLRDGQDLDVDAAIDAWAELRAGVPPSDNIYMSRVRAERDVALVLLVDLSSSTGEFVQDAHGGRLQRVIDLEREALGLLVEPLSLLGDAYGIYGFSGTSRRDVHFVVIKDLRERMHADVFRRLAALRPLHTTRMGAAIRHATARLRDYTAATRILMVISDGRPYDTDYGERHRTGGGIDTDYAIHDTRAALDEARRARIRPYLLTIDVREDYLRTMCRGLDYETIGDVVELPKKVASLFRRLTV
jgi:nitric oxide reductase NorD protein